MLFEGLMCLIGYGCLENLNHYLIGTSLVTHLGHQTIVESTPEEIKLLTIEQVKKYNKKVSIR